MAIFSPYRLLEPLLLAKNVIKVLLLKGLMEKPNFSIIQKGQRLLT